MKMDTGLSRKFNVKIIFLPLVLALLLIMNNNSFSQTRQTWNGGGTAGQWDDANNWDNGGSLANGDTAVITSSQSATITSNLGNFSPSVLIVESGATLEIDQSGGTLITSDTISVVGTLTMTDGNLTATGIVVRGGTVNFGGGSHIVEGNDLQLESGTVNSDSATININFSFGTFTNANFTKNGGSFNAGSSTYKFISGVSQTISSNDAISFYNLEHTPSATSSTLTLNTSTYTILNEFVRGGGSNGITVNSGLTYSDSTTLRYTLGSARNVSGEWVSPGGVDNVINASSADLTLTSDRTIPSDGSIVINQTSGNFIVSGGTTVLTVNGSLERRTSGTTGITESGGGQVEYAATGSILKYNTTSNTTIGEEWPAAGSSPPENVEITLTPGILSSSGALSRTIAQDLTLNVGTVNLGTGTLTVSGTVTGSDVSGSAIINDNTTLLIGNGASDNSNEQTITGNITLNNLTVDKRNGTVTADTTVTVSGSVSFSANGTLIVTQGILAFSGPGKLTGTLASLSVTISSGGVLKTGGTSLTTIGGTISTANGKVVFDGSSVSETMPAWSLSELEVDNANGVSTSAGTLNVSGSLTLTNGIITTTSANSLRLGSSAAVAGTPGATRMIVGPLQRAFNTVESFTYPVGSGSIYCPAVFAYTGGTISGSGSIIEVEHSSAGFTPKTLPGGISAVQTTGHYIVQEAGTPPSGGFTYAFTGTFEDGNFNPENRNRVLVETLLTYTVGLNPVVNETANTAYGDGFSALPAGSNLIVFGAGGTTITWDGDASPDNSWFTAINWSSDAVPTSADNVAVTGAVTIDIDGGAAQALTLTLGDEVNIVSVNITATTDSIWIYGTSSSALTVRNASEIILSHGGSIIFDPAGSAAYDSSRTGFLSGSFIEYLADTIEADIYGNLVINGADTCRGDLIVQNTLEKASVTAFSSSNDITVNGNYTNTAGNATYSGANGLTVNGSQFTVTAGIVTGIVNINAATTTVNGGSFAGYTTLSGTVAQTINGSATAAFDTLAMNNSGGLTLGTDVTSDTLVLTSGIVTTSASNLMTLTTGTTGSATSFINGPLAISGATGTNVFPVGKSVYRPLTAFNITSTGTPTAQVEVFDTAPTQSFDVALVRISQVRYSVITLTGADITGGTIRLSYGSDDGVSVFNQAGDVVVAISSDEGSTDPYSDIGGELSGSVPDGFVTSVDVGIVPTGVYSFTLGTTTGDNSLPVELSSFAANPSFKEVVLSWKTFSELENQGFYLYRRQAEIDVEWTQINQAIIQGQGNTSQATEYEFIDRSAAGGNKYEYMLESISYAGVRVQEKVIEVDVPVPANYALLGNYPNPFNPATNIRFQLPEKSEITVKIYDMRGNLVDTPALKKSFDAGEHDINWTAQNNSGRRVASGMYIYLFQAGNFQKTGKMVLLK